MSVEPYGPAIHQAIAGGKLSQMRSIAKAAEKHLAAHGNVRAALEVLKAEIAKLEAKK